MLLTGITPSGVYAVIDAVTRVVYVGASRNIAGRCELHASQLRLQRHPYQRDLGEAWAAGRLEVSVLEHVANRSEMTAAEQRWIDHFRASAEYRILNRGESRYHRQVDKRLTQRKSKKPTMPQNDSLTLSEPKPDAHLTTMRLVPNLVRLRDLRLRAAMSQADLAERAGVARTTIVRLEAGDPNVNPSTLRKLARALRVRPAELWEERES